jgi:hypothetical protein
MGMQDVAGGEGVVPRGRSVGLDVVSMAMKGGAGVSSPQIVHAETNYACGHFADIFVVVWRDETTLSGVRALREHFEPFARARRKVGLINIIEEGAALPAAEARQALARLMSDSGEHIAVSAVVFEGRGFRSAAVRGVVTGLSMLARQPYPHRVCATLSEAAEWFAEMSPEAWGASARSIEEGVGNLREMVT